MAEPIEAPVHQHRSRLLEGMARAVTARGYGETTIADIVREAAVSRRTFYEHFSTKTDCLIALYEAASHNALEVLRQAIDPALGWEDQVDHAMRAYLGAMAASPQLVRTFFIEILALGPQGLASRRRVNREIAEFMLAIVNARPAPGSRPLSAEMAMAVVGGVNELVLGYIEQDRVADLQALAGPAGELLKAVTHAC